MTEASTAASDVPGSSADKIRRGTSFPTMSLPDAVKIIHKAGQYGSDFSANAFAGYCEHTSANSGPFRSKVAAFKDWSLISSNGDRVVLTDLGKRFAKAEEPLADAVALREAFLRCPIFKGMYDDSPKETAIKVDGLWRSAVQDHGVAPKSRDRFLASLVESATASGLAVTSEEGRVVTFSAGAAASDEAPADQAGEVEVPADSVVQRSHAAGVAGRKIVAPAVLRQAWPTRSGEVVLTVHSTEPLPAQAFTLIGEAVTAAAKLAEFIGPEKAATGTSPPPGQTRHDAS